jgi:hypothetical protein
LYSTIPPMIPILNLFNPIYTFPYYLFKTYFKMFFCVGLDLAWVLFRRVLSVKYCVCMCLISSHSCNMPWLQPLIFEEVSAIYPTLTFQATNKNLLLCLHSKNYARELAQIRGSLGYFVICLLLSAATLMLVQ